jgi:predicted phage tail protein
MTSTEILAPLSAIAPLMPDTSGMNRRAEASLQLVKDFVIASNDDYMLAAEELQNVKARATALETRRTTITGPLNKVFKAVNDLFREPKTYLEQAEELWKTKMLGWQQEQARIAAEEHAKAEKVIADERRRIADEAAARQRQADEETAALKRQAELGAAQGDSAAAAQAVQQIALVQSNAAAEVAALQQTALVITAPVTTAPPPRAAGISTAKTWDYELKDLLKVVQHVAAHPEHISILKLDEVKTRALVRALGKNLGIEGIDVFEKSTLSARAKVAA